MRRFRVPSPALAVAMLALFVAVGGTATAAGVLITSSKQIKAGAIDASDISAKARSQLTGAAGAPGERGAAGATGAPGATGVIGPAGAIGLAGAIGATGAAGPKGDKGEKGDPGVSGSNAVVRESPSAPVPATGTTIVPVTAQCLPGERATGGGYDVSGAGEFGTIAVDSQPTGPAAAPNGWTVKVNNVTALANNPQASTVVAKVICAAP
jgi:hypothetical protein